MTKKTLLYLIIYSSGLIQASSIIHKAISHIPEIENVSAVMHASSQLNTAQAGRLNMTQASHFADDYKRYLRTGKGDPLLYNLISDDSLKNGYQPLGLTAADVRKIKSFLIIEHTQKEITSVFLDSEIFVFPNLPNWLASEYKNVTNEIVSGINYKRYHLDPDNACQSIGEALAPRLLEDLDGIRSYFYCKKNYIGKNKFIENEKSRVELAFGNFVNNNKYVFIDYSKIKKILEDIGNFDRSIKYLIVLQEDLENQEIVDFLTIILKKRPDLVVVLAFKDSDTSIPNFFLRDNALFKNLIIAGKGITKVGNMFFGECSSLETLDLPTGITKIENFFLYECSKLKHVNLPQNLIQIGDSFLSGCTSLQTLNLPQSIKQVGDVALNKCSNLRIVNLPQNLTQVGDYFLAECSSLETLDVSQGIRDVGKGFLFSCSKLRIVNLSQNLTKVGDDFLYGCNNLKTVKLPQDLTRVGDYFLAECSSLQTLDLPQGVTQVGKSFLAKCSSLQTLDLPKNLLQIGKDFLAGCINLKELTLTKALYDKIHNEFQDVKFKFYENEHQSLEPEEIGAAAAAAKSK